MFGEQWVLLLELWHQCDISGAACSLKKYPRGPIMQISSYPLQKIAFYTKFHKLIKYNVFISYIKGTFQINKGHNASAA